MENRRSGSKAICFGLRHLGSLGAGKIAELIEFCQQKEIELTFRSVVM